jgi:membrane protein involved in colicin uptake
MPTPTPDYSQGKALLDEIVKGKSTRYQEELKRLEEEAAARAIAEANAKAAAELKAKQEADAKTAAELKAKQEAETKAAAEKIVSDAKAEAARILVEAKAKAAAAKKTTITCTKGKLTKKVTAVKPKCPVGYKVKK